MPPCRPCNNTVHHTMSYLLQVQPLVDKASLPWAPVPQPPWRRAPQPPGSPAGAWVAPSPRTQSRCQRLTRNRQTRDRLGGACPKGWALTSRRWTWTCDGRQNSPPRPPRGRGSHLQQKAESLRLLNNVSPSFVKPPLSESSWRHTSPPQLEDLAVILPRTLQRTDKTVGRSLEFW